MSHITQVYLGLKDLKPLILVTSEFIKHNFKVYSNDSIINCKSFEDNFRILEMEQLPNL